MISSLQLMAQKVIHNSASTISCGYGQISIASIKVERVAGENLLGQDGHRLADSSQGRGSDLAPQARTDMILLTRHCSHSASLKAASLIAVFCDSCSAFRNCCCGMDLRLFTTECQKP